MNSKKIMIAMDETKVWQAALAEGLKAARAYDAQILLYYVLPNFVLPMPITVKWTPEDHFNEAKVHAAKSLTAAATLARRWGVKTSEALGSGDDAAACLARAAMEKKCELIVIGSHGRNAIERLVMGSVVTRLITLSPVPVLVCKQKKSTKAGAMQSVPTPKIEARKRTVASTIRRRAATAQR